MIETPTNILKLLDGGIDLVLPRGETLRGERWQDTDDIAQKDERITALLEDPCFREVAKEAYIKHMEIGWEDLFMERMAIRWRRDTEKLKPRTMKCMNLMIEWGRSCWAARNRMIYGEKHQCNTLLRKRIQIEARVYLYAPKEEALVPIENIRATGMLRHSE